MPLTGEPRLRRPMETLRRDGDSIEVLDQTALPFRVTSRRLGTVDEVAEAILSLRVRGAPLIGAAAAFGVAIAMSARPSLAALEAAEAQLGATRPTAVNLHWALARMHARLVPLPEAERRPAAWAEAEAIAAEDAGLCLAIGRHGAAILDDLAGRRSAWTGLEPSPIRSNGPGVVRVMTHCNAGWLATCGIGTALAPVYVAHAQGVPVEVIVSETRPRNQGLLTAWELAEAGVPHTLIADNAAGHLLATGAVDVVITGADRIAANGDTANKVGTWLKALAAREAGVPFYVAAPSSTLDLGCSDGGGIPIEDRGSEEVLRVHGLDSAGRVAQVAIAPSGMRVVNPAFDITPARLIAGFITERGLVTPTALFGTFTDRNP